MITRRKKLIPAAVITVLSLTAAVVVASLSLGTERVDFNYTFFYVCYDSPTGASSAASVSSAVHSYGGAGYVIESGGEYLVTVACYYSKEDADGVCATLNGRGLRTRTVAVTCGNYFLKGRERRNAEKYAGNLNTLTQLSVVLYGLANRLDEGSLAQQGARAVLADFGEGLKALLKSNPSNCFTGELKRLVAAYNDVNEGYVLSREVRRLQVAVTDAVVNVNII